MELTDLLTELKTLDDKKFRLQNQKFMLTYKSHVDKIALKAFLQNLSKTNCLTKFYCAHECGTDDPITPYEHSHAVVDFGYCFTSSKARVFDFDNIHPHISIIKDVSAWKKSCKYITKEDKTVILDKTDPREVVTTEMIWDKPNIQEALREQPIGSATNIIAAYKFKPRKPVIPNVFEEDFYPFQKSIVEKTNLEPDSRSCHWLTETIGCKGKTQFARTLCILYPEKYYIFNSIGKISDFANNISNMLDSGFDGNTVFINLSRSYADRTALYEAIEILKDGFVTGTKYKGGLFFWNNVHVWVFSNFPPMKVNDEGVVTLSKDRWKEYRIGKDLELLDCP